MIFKETNESRNKDQHLNDQISVGENSNSYFEKLIELSERTASGFWVKGQFPIVEIKFGKFNWLFGSLFFIFISFFILGAIKNINEPIYIFFPLGILIIALLHAKFWSITNKITLDCERKILIIESNHFLGKLIDSKKIISFGEITNLNKKLKMYHSRTGQTHKKYRIIVETENKEYQLFEIPAGPLYFVNENTMIQSILGIVKNAK